MSDGLLSVIKLGGSLLDFDGLLPALREWLAAETAGRKVIIVGGGHVADVVRAAERMHGFGDVASHWLSIAAMSLNTRLLAELLGEASLVTQWADLTRPSRENPLLLFDVTGFLKVDEPLLPGERLPVGWDVTSDSIAARVAVAFAADQLVLLKSSLPPGCATPEVAREIGYVDRFFPTAAATLPMIRCVNLRDGGFAERRLEG